MTRTRQTVEHEVGEDETHDSEWPDDQDNPPRSEAVCLGTTQRVTPVPQSGNPNLLRSLHETCTHGPNFSSSTLEIDNDEYAEKARNR